MPKQVRHSRTQARGAATGQQPSVRSRVVPQETPNVRAVDTKLPDLLNNMTAFFGNAGSSIMDAVAQGERIEQEQENREAERSATADVLAGRERNPDLKENRTYMDTYRDLTAKRTAFQASRDFVDYYRNDFLSENPDGDLKSARNQWIVDNLSGFDDSQVEAVVLNQFVKNTDEMLSTHDEYRFKRHQFKTMEDLDAQVQDSIAAGEFTPDTFQEYLEDYKTLDPLNPGDAAPRLSNAVVASIANNPETAHQVMSVMEQPGTGRSEDRSFAQDFPQAYAGLQAKALEAWGSVGSINEQEQIDQFATRISKAPALSEEELFELQIDMEVFKYRNGNSSAVQGLFKDLGKVYDNRAETMAEVQGVEDMLSNPEVMDPSHVRENYSKYLQHKYGAKSIMQMDPSAATYELSRLRGVVPQEVRGQLSAGLMSSENVETQAQVIELLRATGQASNGLDPRSFLNDDAAVMWDWVSNTMELTNEDPQTVAMKLNNIRPKLDEARKLGFAEVYPDGGETDTEVKDSLSTQIKDGLRERIGGQFDRDQSLDPLWSPMDLVDFALGFEQDVSVDPALEKQMMEYVKKEIYLSGEQGVSADDAITNALDRIAPQMEVFAQNGQLRVRIADMKPGQPHMGPKVYNPTTGEHTNTLDVFMDDLGKTAEKIPEIFEDTSGFSFMRDKRLSSQGAYLVAEDGLPMAFQGGEEIDLPAIVDGERDGDRMTHFKLPETGTEEDLQAVREMFEPYLSGPEGAGFGVMNIGSQDNPQWAIAYKPHFGENTGKTIDEREQETQERIQRNKETKIEQMGETMRQKGKSMGVIPFSFGVAMAAAAPSSGQDIIDQVSKERERGVKQDGPRFMDKQKVDPQDTYRQRRFRTLVGHESVRNYAYDDATGGKMRGSGAKGNVTVGAGFNMDQRGAREIWGEVFGDTVDFDKVYRGEQKLNDTQVKRLFDHTIKYYEGVVDDAAGDRNLTENQRLALVSIAYNSPHRVERMSKEIQEGDTEGLIEDILYRSFNPRHSLRQSLAARRYREATMFLGHTEAWKHLPDREEYISYWAPNDPSDRSKPKKGAERPSFPVSTKMPEPKPVQVAQGEVTNEEA